MLKTMLKTRYKNDTLIECGLDEAGRGCLWGPFFAGAVIWKKEELWDDELRKLSEEIKDSKKITTAKKRERLYEGIKKHAEAYGVGVVTNDEIDFAIKYFSLIIERNIDITNFTVSMAHCRMALIYIFNKEKTK